MTNSKKSSYQWNRRQYDEFALEYDAKRRDRLGGAYNRILEQPLMRRLLPRPPRGKWVVDLGCGTGIFSGYLMKRGAKVVGVDASKVMLALAKKNCPRNSWVEAPVTKTGLKSASADWIVSGLVLHYLPRIEPFYKEANRLLKKGGHFIFSFHHPFGECFDFHGMEILRPYFSKGEYSFVIGSMKLVAYHRTLSEIIDRLGQHGFIVEKYLESRPSTALKHISPRDYQDTLNLPRFAGICARKI